MKKYLSPSRFYELSVPDDWDYLEEDNLVSFYNQNNGVGSLQISSYRISEEYKMNLKQELAEFVAERLSVNFNGVLPKIEGNSNFTSFKGSLEDGTYWEYYMLFNNQKLLLLTYNCNLNDSHTEEETLDSILKSIKIL